MLGDAAVYAFTLFVLGRSARWGGYAAMLKGLLMAGFGAAVLMEGIRRAVVGGAPEPGGMALVALLALVANVSCLVLLLRHRTDDLNMKSTWLCSRNDVLANLGVMVERRGRLVTRSPVPDLVVGFAIAVLFLQSAFSVIRESWAALKSRPAGHVEVES